MNSPDAAVSPAGLRGAEAGAEARSSCPGDCTTPWACAQLQHWDIRSGSEGTKGRPGLVKASRAPGGSFPQVGSSGCTTLPRTSQGCAGKGRGHRLRTAARLPSYSHPVCTRPARGHGLQISHCRKVLCKRRLSPSVNTSGPCSESEPTVFPPPRRCQALARCR